MTTLTSGALTITPTQVDGYVAATESTTVRHVNLDGSIDVSIGDDLPLTGQLVLLFATESAAWSAHASLKTAAVWTLTDPDVTSVGMQFVRQGEMTLELDDESRTFWTLTVGYQAVTS